MFWYNGYNRWVLKTGFLLCVYKLSKISIITFMFFFVCAKIFQTKRTALCICSLYVHELLCACVSPAVRWGWMKRWWWEARSPCGRTDRSYRPCRLERSAGTDTETPLGSASTNSYRTEREESKREADRLYQCQRIPLTHIQLYILLFYKRIACLLLWANCNHICKVFLPKHQTITSRSVHFHFISFSHLAHAFIQSDLQKGEDRATRSGIRTAAACSEDYSLNKCGGCSTHWAKQLLFIPS